MLCLPLEKRIKNSFRLDINAMYVNIYLHQWDTLWYRNQSPNPFRNSVLWRQLDDEDVPLAGGGRPRGGGCGWGVTRAGLHQQRQQEEEGEEEGHHLTNTEGRRTVITMQWLDNRVQDRSLLLHNYLFLILFLEVIYSGPNMLITLLLTVTL